MLKTETNPQPNPPVAIPVRIFGMDSDGKPFVQLATARNLTSERAVIDLVEHRLVPGEVVGLQYKERKSRVRVLWACEMDGAKTNQLGVQLTNSRECPWQEVVVEEDTRGVHGIRERRRFQRHQVAMGLELTDLASGKKIRARSSDVSMGGCYIETSLPLAAGTRLEIEIASGPTKVSASAIVRTSDPGVGMGIEFIGVTAQKEQQLEDLLRSCSRRLPTMM